jgi:hypothetical protein
MSRPVPSTDSATWAKVLATAAAATAARGLPKTAMTTDTVAMRHVTRVGALGVVVGDRGVGGRLHAGGIAIDLAGLNRLLTTSS